MSSSALTPAIPCVAIVDGAFSPDVLEGVVAEVARLIETDKEDEHTAPGLAPLFISRGMGADGNVRLGMLRGDRTCWVTPALCKERGLVHIPTIIRR